MKTCNFIPLHVFLLLILYYCNYSECFSITCSLSNCWSFYMIQIHIFHDLTISFYVLHLLEKLCLLYIYNELLWWFSIIIENILYMFLCTKSCDIILSAVIYWDFISDPNHLQEIDYVFVLLMFFLLIIYVFVFCFFKRITYLETFFKIIF